MQRDGAERVIARLANYYAEIGYHVDIIVLLVNDCEYKLHSNVHIISLVRENKSRYQNTLYWISHIRTYIKREQPSHIISFSMYVNIFTLIACAGLKTDILISERNDPSSDGRSAFDRFLTNILYSKADKVVFQTKRARSCFSKRIRKNSRIIYNPVEVTCLASEKKSEKIVTVGRLEPQKNQKLLITAFKEVSNIYTGLILEIYGKGSLKEELVNLVKKLNLQDKVRFQGNVTNIHERIKDAKAFILSSDYEGLSNALLEAMMMGIPCISTRCAGSDEIIRNKENGILVNINDKQDLQMAILELLGNEELQQKFAQNGKITARQFKKNKVIKQWVNYIDS